MMLMRAKFLTSSHCFALLTALLAAVMMASPVSAQNAPAAPVKKAAPPSAAAKLQAQANAEAKAQVPSKSQVQAKAKANANAVTKADATAIARGPINLSPSVIEPVSPEASADDLAIAQQIHQGLLPCEMGTSIRVEADAAQPGYFHVQGKGFRYRMFPVRTNTGALRLEDKKAGAVWLQLANKSMLMDEKKGRRVADECAHPDQVAFSEKMKTNPLPSLLD
ncbi:MAG: hypothetical protein RIT44_2111 [Pseudomonadota bacterium]|jgi:hypothetical protein